MPFGEAAGLGYNNPVNNRIVVIAPGKNQGIFVYAPTVGPGDLVASLTAVNGTDQYGNPYSGPGLEVQAQGDATTYIFVGLNSGNVPIIRFGTRDPLEASTAIIDAAITNSGLARAIVMFLQSALLNLPGHTDRVGIQLDSPNAGGTSSANLEFKYFDQAGGNELYATMDATGFNILAGSYDAVDPATGTVATPAIPETWHPIVPINGWTASAGEGGPSIRLRDNRHVELYAVIQGGIITNNTPLFNTIPVAYTPVTTKRLLVEFNAGAGAATSEAHITVTTAGLIESENFPIGTTQIVLDTGWALDI